MAVAINTRILKKRGQLYKSVSSFSGGGVEDNIFNVMVPDPDNPGEFLPVERISKSIVNVAEAGITGTGDMTTKFNAACNNAKIDSLEIFLEDSDTITINGVLDAKQTEFIFRPGTRFTGTGTIKNAIINANINAHIFDITLTLENCSTTTPYFSAKWFGAKGEGNVLQDDRPPIQKSIDTVIRNGSFSRVVVLPRGVYYIQNSILFHCWDDTAAKWLFATVELVGQNSSYFTLDSLATTIRYIGPFDGFAVGMQVNKCSEIRGIDIVGQFAPAYPNYASFAQATYANFGGSHPFSEKITRPYSGIAIDPGGITDPVVPGDATDNGYHHIPGFSLNRGPGGGLQGGSSACRIINCRVRGFICDINYSSNRSIQNCESMIIQDCSLELCKVAVSYGQDQTKNCTIQGVIGWDTVHTFCSNTHFGYQNGCPPKIDTLDIAGMVYQLFRIDAAGRFGMENTNIYCESLVKLGLLTAMPSSINHSHFDFGGLLQGGMTPDTYFKGHNVAFSNCVLRHYDNQFNKRIWMEAFGCMFRNTQFDLPPIFYPFTDSAKPSARANEFKQCHWGPNGYNILDDSLYSDYAYDRAIVGVFKSILNRFKFNSRTVLSYASDSYDYSFNAGTLLSVTVNADRTATFPWSGADTAWYFRLGQYVYGQFPDVGTVSPKFTDTTESVAFPILGRITALSSTQITVSEVPVNVPTGTGSWLLWFTTVNQIDVPITANSDGSAVLTNVVGGRFPAAGTTLYSEFFSGKVLSSNAGLRTITLTAGTGIVATDILFATGKPEIVIESHVNPDDVNISTETIPLLKGTIWKNTTGQITNGTFEKKIFKITKSGWLTTSAGPVQAEWQEIGDTVDPFSLTADGTRTFEAKQIEYIQLRPSTAMKIRIGTTTGGHELFGETNLSDMDAMTPNKTEIIPVNQAFDAGGTLYITGDFASGLLKIKVFKKPL